MSNEEEQEQEVRVLPIRGHANPDYMYAYISIENGKSGICAGPIAGIPLVPLIGATLNDMEKYKSMVNQLRKKLGPDSGIEIKLAKYQRISFID